VLAISGKNDESRLWKQQDNNASSNTYIAFAHQKAGTIINLSIKLSVFQFQHLAVTPSNWRFTKVPAKTSLQ
jgi:hypothetical protein